KTLAGPVVVLVLDRDQLARYQAMVSELRSVGVRAELYLGQSGMRAQLKYADKRAAPIVVIEGGDERAKGEVTLKDMALGAELSGEIKSRAEWAKAAVAQVSIRPEDLARRVRAILERHRTCVRGGAAPGQVDGTRHASPALNLCARAEALWSGRKRCSCVFGAGT